MAVYRRILVFHAGAIGDTILATPVVKALKSWFPQAEIMHMVHEATVALVRLNPSVDTVFAFDKSGGILGASRQFASHKPDLVVDLSGKFKYKLAAMLAGVPSLHYCKQPAHARPVQHAADNFMATIASLLPSGRDLVPEFPTLTRPHQETHEALLVWSGVTRQAVPALDQLPRIIALVPGVGVVRPSRSWPEASWIELARQLGRDAGNLLVLVGGKDETDLCGRIAAAAGGTVANLSGQLSLVQTAGLLGLSKLVVSGDTGPAHIAVAVGVPVVGIMGATLPERSGPYGMAAIGLDASSACQCAGLKSCKLAPPGPGACMQVIPVDAVASAIDSCLAAAGKH